MAIDLLDILKNLLEFVEITDISQENRDNTIGVIKRGIFVVMIELAKKELR